MADPHYSPTHRRIINLLSDGLRHTRHEIFACLDDDLAQLTAIQFHISILRKILRPRGEDISCELYCGGIYYRHVRLLHSPNDGKR